MFQWKLANFAILVDWICFSPRLVLQPVDAGMFPTVAPAFLGDFGVAADMLVAVASDVAVAVGAVDGGAVGKNVDTNTVRTIMVARLLGTDRHYSARWIP